ncbi:MAG: hypothetical protein FJ395_20405 [Verrucomicrobia bacterium]|nr:hypothetical protein [Verrucomicrobiota bacterium]
MNLTPDIAAYRAHIGQRIPLSFAQYRIGYLQQLYRDDVMYNVARAFRIHGPLDTEAVRRALRVVAERHEPLRSRIALDDDGLPFQQIENEPQIDFECVDLTGSPPSDTDAMVRECVVKPFELFGGSLHRTRCFRLGASEWILLFVQHHIITDYLSWRLFLSEFSAAYASGVTGAALSLPPVPLRYSEFAKRQWQELPEDWITQAHAFWRRFFAREVGAATEAEQPAPVTYGKHSQQFSPSVIRACKSVATGQATTLFTLVLSAVSILAGKLYRDREVMVCFATGNRKHANLMPLIGCFFTNIILRLDVSQDRDLAALLCRAKDQFARARQEQRLPFEMFADDLSLEATRHRRPPYRIYISYRNLATNTEFSLADLNVEPIQVSTGRNTQEDIVFNFFERTVEGELFLDLEWLWRLDRFDPQTIKEASGFLESLFDRFRNELPPA